MHDMSFGRDEKFRGTCFDRSCVRSDIVIALKVSYDTENLKNLHFDYWITGWILIVRMLFTNLFSFFSHSSHQLSLLSPLHFTCPSPYSLWSLPFQIHENQFRKHTVFRFDYLAEVYIGLNDLYHENESNVIFFTLHSKVGG